MTDLLGADYAELLAKVELFAGLDRVVLARLAGCVEPVAVADGAEVVRQGEPGDALYLVTRGIFRVVVPSPDGLIETRLGTLFPGDYFGEMALINDEPRSATVRAEGGGEVLRLERSRFLELLRAEASVAPALFSTVSRRLRKADSAILQRDQAFAQLVEQALGVLSPERRRQVLQASVLDEPSPQALAVLFAEDARAVVQALQAVSMGGPQPPAPVLYALRKAFEREIGADGVQAFVQQAAWRLAEAQRWDEALGLFARHAARPAYLAVLGRALRATPPLSGTQAARWVERVSDDEAAQDAELALARAALYEQRGDVDAAARLLRRALGSALTSGDVDSGRDLKAAMARLTRSDVSPFGGLGYGLGSSRGGAGREVPRAMLGLALALLALLGGWLIPPPPGLAAEGWRALATLVAVVPVLALGALPEGIVALLLAAVWVMGGVAPTRVALSGFASGTWVLVVSVLAVGAALASTGLLYRLALWAVGNTRGGFTGQALALGLAGLLIGPAVPNATSRITLVAPALTELVEALGYKPNSRPAVGLAMATLIGFGQMVGPFLTSSTTALLVFAVLPESARAGLDWGTWALRAAPLHALLFPALMAALLWLYRPRADDAPARAAPPRSSLALQRALLGPLSRQERIALAVAAGLLLGFATQPLHGVALGWLGVLALGVLAATGVLGGDGLRSVNWSFALLFASLISMVEVFSTTGLDRWLGEVVASALSGLVATPVLFLAALTLLGYGISLVVRWQAAAPLLTIAVAPVAGAAGIDPWLVGLVVLISCCGFFLPYQNTVYLALYHGTGGKLFSHRQARPAALAYGVLTLLAVCASVPVWHAMRLV